MCAEPINIFMAVNFYKNDLSIGVTKKLIGIIYSFRRKGYSVYYSAYGTDGIEIYNNEDVLEYKQAYHSKNKNINEKLHRFELLSATRLYLKNTNVKFDIIYSRWLGFDIPYIRMLRTAKMKHNAFVMIDMHSYFPGISFKTIKGKYMIWNTNLFKRQASKLTDEYIVEGNLPFLFGKQTVTSAMGVDVESLTKHKYKGSKEEINIISVANENIYHGYDRLIKGLADYKKRNRKIRVNIHLVGVISDSTKNLIKSNSLENDVVLYGKLQGDDLMQVYAKCNVAAGPLGQHRVGGKKDPGLKTKEYFGIGIPYFYSGVDIYIPKNYKYVLQVPSDDTDICIEDIINFYESYKDIDSVSDEMRDYAKTNFSWDRATDAYLSIFNERRRLNK